MNTIRRDLFKFGGGAALGAALSPLPWRLLGDTAIWSQNWSWMPRTPRGERSEKEVRCSLCPAGCSLKARCVEGLPFAMVPAAGAICPRGWSAITLRFIPCAFGYTLYQGTRRARSEAEAAARRVDPREMAVLDLAPGRIASRLHSERMRKAGGHYLAAPCAEGSTARALATRLGSKNELRMHLPAARTVLSLQTPVLDGWAPPSISAKRNFSLVQADVRRSHTARRADEWIRLLPGGETALLLALSEILAGGGRVEELAQRAGATLEQLKATAQRLSEGPALIIADGDPLGDPMAPETLQAAVALQVQLGLEAYREGGARFPGGDWASVAPASIRLLVIDEPAPGLTIPWASVSPKLAPDAVVAAVTWNRQSFARHATWQVPAPVYLEGLQESMPNQAEAADRVVSEGWMPPPEEAVYAADFVAAICGESPDYQDRMKQAEPHVWKPLRPASPPPLSADEMRALRASALRPVEGLQVSRSAGDRRAFLLYLASCGRSRSCAPRRTRR